MIPNQAMSTMTAIDHGIEASAWWVLTATSANVLLVGDDASALRILTRVWPALRRPVVWQEAACFSLSREARGTLVLQNPDALSDVNQHRLLEWLSGAGAKPRVLTTSTTPLFPLVEAGRFLDSLYYHLNMVRLEVA
jgi:hypothetical protein